MITHLIRQSRVALVVASLACLCAGVASVLLVVLINTALTAEPAARGALAGQFAGVALFAMLTRMAASLLFERLGQQGQADLRRYITDRAMRADYARLEEVGADRLQSALTEHSANIAQYFVMLPAILTNAVIVAGCLIYLALLSWQVFLVAVLVVGLGSLGYHFAHLRAIRHLEVAAREQDGLFAGFRSVNAGAKELRLHQGKRAAFTQEVLHRSIEAVRRARTRGMSIFVVSTSWSHFLIYAFIGLVLFALAGEGAGQQRVMTGFALVFLYMVAPLEALLLNIPRANLARVAARRIDAIIGGLVASESPAPVSDPPTALQSVALHGVTHVYYHEQSDDTFQLGPLDLAFGPGEIVFLVGGNGSGKTTLAKLLVGLYRPEQGEIILDGVAVTDANRDAYRQRYSAIFSDFHLFDRLLEASRANLDDEGNRWLERLMLNHKVQVRDGAFSTQALSQGQRKRLALVVAYLENRPFIVFDEWAADQDPVFKDVFYRELLSELKARGKMVLVISHDDRYFDLADRILRMEHGQLLADAGTAPVARPAGTRPARAGFAIPRAAMVPGGSLT